MEFERHARDRLIIGGAYGQAHPAGEKCLKNPLIFKGQKTICPVSD
jgi:hypothetical protein